MHDEHVNVTPLIDVVMCLIIFFLACSHLARSEANDRVQIPRAELGQEMSEQRGRLLINIVPHERLTGETNTDDRPDIIIRGQQIAPNDLTDYLKREKRDQPDLKVVIRADRDLGYAWISPVMVSCVQASINSVNFSTRK
jgi:biopolymer transport protein ExbD